MFKTITDKLWFLRGIYCFFSDIKRRYIMPKNRALYSYYGRGVSLQVPCYITDFGSCHIGDYSAIRYGFNLINTPNVSFRMGKYCVIGPNCTIVTGNHAQTVGLPQIVGCRCHVNDDDRDVILEDSVWLGTNVTILPGVTIGRGAIVGAGSVVNKDLPPYSVSVGVPARTIATTFGLDEIVLHERKIYPEGERYSKDFLTDLFDTKFKGLKSIGHNSMPEEKRVMVEDFLRQINVCNLDKISVATNNDNKKWY